MTKPQPVRWMALFSTPNDLRPSWLPADIVLIRISGGDPVPAAIQSRRLQRPAKHRSKWRIG